MAKGIEERHGKSLEVALIARGDGHSVYSRGGGDHGVLAGVSERP